MLKNLNGLCLPFSLVNKEMMVGQWSEMRYVIKFQEICHTVQTISPPNLIHKNPIQFFPSVPSVPGVFISSRWSILQVKDVSTIHQIFCEIVRRFFASSYLLRIAYTIEVPHNNP
ncbi:unnamed protein product [Cuscuta europaea]|uniref:Uncharacterized protein n=1 Tax=Cuscuta europaea TaxID=41803 RepID=A0A9P1EK84_CUSEU|nr:unnamed protein product [Cuscuta europaea]